MISAIRIPASAASAVMSHADFRYLGCAGRLRGDWIERASDGALFFEVRNPDADDAQEFMQFAQRVAGHLIEKT